MPYNDDGFANKVDVFPKRGKRLTITLEPVSSDALLGLGLF